MSMKQFENILITASEECAEIQQAISKALRFGLDNHHPDRPNFTNADDIMQEFIQLCAVIELLQCMGKLPMYCDSFVQSTKNKKVENIVKWQQVSIDCKTLEVDELEEDED